MEAIFLKAIFASILSFLVTFYLVPVCIIMARRLQFIDEPDGKIKKHKIPTPYLGGVAVYVGFLAAFCLTFPFESNMLLFFAGATLLLFVGLCGFKAIAEIFWATVCGAFFFKGRALS